MESSCFGRQASHSTGTLPAWLPKAVFLQQMGDKRGHRQRCTPMMGLFKSCFHFCEVLCIPSVIRTARSSCYPVTQ